MFQKNKKSNLPDTTAIDTVIGSHCRIEGNIHASQSLKIDGEIQGNVDAGGTVVIEETGRIGGNIHCTDLMVFGRIEGPVETERLHLKSTAQVHGNIRTQTLLVEEGAVYTGDIRMDNRHGSETDTV